MGLDTWPTSNEEPIASVQEDQEVGADIEGAKPNFTAEDWAKYMNESTPDDPETQKWLNER